MTKIVFPNLVRAARQYVFCQGITTLLFSFLTCSFRSVGFLMQWTWLSCRNKNFSILLSCAPVFTRISSSLLSMLPWPVACIVGGCRSGNGGEWDWLKFEWPCFALVGGWARSSRWTDAVYPWKIERSLNIWEVVYEIAGPSGRPV